MVAHRCLLFPFFPSSPPLPPSSPDDFVRRVLMLNASVGGIIMGVVGTLVFFFSFSFSPSFCRIRQLLSHRISDIDATLPTPEVFPFSPFFFSSSSCPSTEFVDSSCRLRPESGSDRRRAESTKAFLPFPLILFFPPPSTEAGDSAT